MTLLNFNSELCRRIRRQLDAYLNNELLVETSGEVVRHLEECEACSRELEARTRVRDVLRRAVANQEAPEALRHSIQRDLRRSQPGFLGGIPQLAWAAALVVICILAGLAGERWVSIRRGREVVANVMAIGVADHVQCAIKGHNYPNVANPPEVLRKKLGPQYAGLLDVVKQKLPDFEVLEAHVCSIPGSPRKYVHFITRGRGTILSVILTKTEGAQFPNGKMLKAETHDGIDLYQAHLDDMNATGFASNGYLGFVVSDLSSESTMQIAEALAPALQVALEESNRSAELWHANDEMLLSRHHDQPHPPFASPFSRRTS